MSTAPHDGFYAVPPRSGERTNHLGVTSHKELQTEVAYARMNGKPPRSDASGRTPSDHERGVR